MLRRFTLLSLCALAFACDSDSNSDLPPVQNPDLGPLDVKEADITADATTDTNTPLQFGDAYVQYDFRSATENAPDPNETARAYQVSDASELLDGPVALGQIGDYVLENQTAKFLIEGATRNMNPCPWGGNVLDAVYLKSETPPEDILGEICLYTNAGLTLKPERFDVLPSVNGAAILAVSGRFTVADYINLASMADDLGPGLGGLIGIDFETIPDAEITIYYVLRPGDNGLKVLTAIRNNGDEQLDLAAAFLIASGGDGYYFNPLGERGGFGASNLNLENINGDPMPFLAFNGERSSYAFVPKPFPALEGDLPISGSYIVISGVAAPLLGTTQLLEVLTANPAKLSTLDGVLHIQPAAIDVVEHTHFVGDGALSTMLDRAYDTIGATTVQVSGRAVEADGSPAAGARVTFSTPEGRAYNQTITDNDGRYLARVPQGETLIARVRRDLQPPGTEQQFNAAEDTELGDISIADESQIVVNVKRADGSATPARITVICDTTCADLPTSQEADISFHNLPDGFAAIVYTGVDGVAEITLPPNDYRVIVSRGMEWSLWPENSVPNGGQLVSLAAGATEVLDAEIAQVLDTGRAISADFHIHTIGSPDSTVAHQDRVKNFMAEGVDIMVTTDHDIITDFAPAIAELGAGNEITSIVGEEITTSDLGHFNAFPVTLDNSVNRRGGAIDWGNGEEVGMTPEQLFEAIDAFPGEQVIQVNHAAGLGYINLTDADVLRGMTFAERGPKRLPLADPDPVSGDTGLWSDDFTAIEIFNGNSQSRFWELTRWWMLMIGRGFAPTGTGVTDTHKLYSDLGGVPRTYTWVGDTTDTPSTFDEPSFVSQVNAGNAIGTNGPYFEVVVTNNNADTIGLRETLATNGAEVTATLDIQVPAWIDASAIDVYVNPTFEDVWVPVDEVNGNPVPPTTTVPITWGPEHDVPVVGLQRTHNARRQTIQIPINVTEDAFVMFIIRGASTMFPIVPSSPFSFSNPFFLDADGNGYDNPPYADEASMLPVDPRPYSAPRPVVLEEVLHEAIHNLHCDHP